MAEKRQKTGGRIAGTPNKVTKELKEVVKGFLDANAKNLQKDFDELQPNERLIFFERLLKYALPTQTRQESNINLNDLTDEAINKIYNHIQDKLYKDE